MPTSDERSDEMNQTLAGALGRVLEHLAEAGEPVPAGLQEQIRAFQRLKGDRGRKAVAEALGIHEAELPFVDASLRDVDRALAAADDADAAAQRNGLLARMRLLSWLETIGHRTPALALDAEVEAVVSEDLGRKQVRAVELIVRSLITESYGEQEALIARLREALNERVVNKWEAHADAGDILSGCSFSELASLFVSKQEFERYEKLYEDTPFLTLLKQRRRTIQSFLDDIRRVRNVLAHNKRVSPIQLSLLDLYYEEIVSPIQTAFDHGETKVDPAVHLDVSKEEIDSYVAGLHEDVQSVKDELADLRADVMASLGSLEAGTARIEQTTTGISRKMYYVAGGVVLAIVLIVLLIVQGGDTQEKVDETRETAKRTESATRETARDVEAVKKGQEALTDVARETAATTKETAKTTKELADSTKEVAETSKEMVKEVKSAKEDVERGAKALEDATAETRKAAEDMEKSSEKVVQTLEELRKGFAALTQTGGIIADARRPQEHYHNARVYEQRGDYAKALTSYTAFFQFDDLEFVDPHLRFQSFLKLQRGLAGAREVYYELKKDSQNLAMQFAWFLLLEGDARADGLDAFIEAHPDFAPAVYARSRDYSVARLGTQSMADKRNEKALLARFLKLKDDSEFLRYYLDQTVTAAQVTDAKERMALLSMVSDEVMKNPVSLSGHRSSSGWWLTLNVLDLHKEIFYRLGTTGAFKSTGFQPHKNFQTGLPMASLSIQLPAETKATVVQLKYKDLRDKMHGPFDLAFEPDVMAMQSMKNMLAHSKNSWLLFGGDGNKYLYFSTVLSYRAILKEIRYGLNKDVPDRSFAFTPADLSSAAEVSSDDPIYIQVKPVLKYATVQLFFKDGTKSEVVRVDRK